LTDSEKEKLTRRFTREISPFIGHDKDIPAPDVGTSAQTMAWMMDTFSLDTGYSQTGVVTGKPVAIGGSKGREAATGLGVVYVMIKALAAQKREIKNATMAIQGFGKVGMHAALEATSQGAKVVAVSDISEGVMALDIGDDSIESMVKVIQAAKTVIWNGPLGYSEVPAFAHGSARLALALATQPDTLSVVGGGDTADFVLKWDGAEGASFGHISTGGGAGLDLMAGKKLPGVESLLDAAK
jgi:hypothetical protein